MRTKKILLGFTAILAVGVATAACSGDDDDDDGTYTLASGDYDLNVNDVPAATNTCFPTPGIGDTLIPLLTSVPLPVQIVSSNGSTFSIVMSDLVDEILPDITGTIDGNDLAATGNAPSLLLTTDCHMAISAVVDGELTGNNQFDITALTADITVPAADAAACSVLVGEPIPNTNDIVPWPILTNGSSGTCTITLVGEGSIAIE